MLRTDRDASPPPPGEPSPPDRACPVCGKSGTLVPILYGLPAMSAELEAALARGDARLGGCLLVPDQPTHACRACDADVRLD